MFETFKVKFSSDDQVCQFIEAAEMILEDIDYLIEKGRLERTALKRVEDILKNLIEEVSYEI